MSHEHPTPLDPEVFGPDNPCFGCSPKHPIGFRLRPERAGDEVLVRYTPGDQFQGPPGVMHGGLVATLGDELAAWTVIGLRGRFGFTAAIDARLLKPVRTGVEVLGRGAIAQETSRTLKIATKLFQEGVEVFRGEFSFVLLEQAAAEKLLGGSLPEHWRKFAR